MGFRFRKSLKIAPGVRMNFGKKSVGMSFGGKGFRKSFNSRGKSTTSVGIPGTGLSYVSTSSKKSNKGSTKKMSSSEKKISWWILAVPALIIIFILGGIKSCIDDNDDSIPKSDTGIYAIEFSDSDAMEFYIGDSDSDYVLVSSHNDFDKSDITFISSDESIFTITSDNMYSNKVYYKIEAVGAGSATVHAETSDGIIKSDDITVTVLDNKIVSIEFSKNEAFNLEEGRTDSGYVKVKYEGNLSAEDITFVSSDESVAAISFSEKSLSNIYYKVNAIGEGTATIHAENKDGSVSSEKIVVNVKKAVTEKITVAKTEVKENSRTVYKTPTGKKYYYSSVCAGDNAIPVSLDDAKNSGLTACKKCAQ